jgi:hypothetical protein
VRQLAAIIFNYVVGGGIFVLPALAASRLGPAAVLAYLVCAVIAGLMVLCFAEAGSRGRAPADPTLRGSGIRLYIAFVVGALNLLSAALATGAVSGIFAASLLTLAGVTTPAARPLVMVAVVGAAAAINIRGLKGGARLVEAATILKLVPLVGFVVVGAFFVHGALPGVDRHAASVGGVCHRRPHHPRLRRHRERPATERRGETAGAYRAAGCAHGHGAVVILYISVQLVAQRAARSGPGRRVGGAARVRGRSASVRWRGRGCWPPRRRRCSATCPVDPAGPRGLFALGRDGFLPRPSARCTRPAARRTSRSWSMRSWRSVSA